MVNSLQAKRHRSALCDALPDKEVPSAWSIYDNSCSKNKSVSICVICGRIFVLFELFVFVNKNLCISVLSVGV